MRTKIVEVTNGPRNWGKFLLGRFEEHEWRHRSVVGHHPSLLGCRGWTREHLLVLDLETGEGVLLCPGGLAAADLDKHLVWVCPMYEPFLVWLYDWLGRGKDPLEVPDHVDLPDAAFELRGYRRRGPEGAP